MLSDPPFILVFYKFYSFIDRKYLKDFYHYRPDTTHYSILKMTYYSITYLFHEF